MLEVRCHDCGRFIGKVSEMAMLYCVNCREFRVAKVDTGRVVLLPLRSSRVSAG